MKNNSNKSNNGTKGIGFGSLLTLAFIVLKLCKVITWSWVWVLSPIWIPMPISIVIAIIYVCVVKKEKIKNDRT